jgi:hypothetical protein
MRNNLKKIKLIKKENFLQIIERKIFIHIALSYIYN